MVEYSEKENDLNIFSSAFKALINRSLCAKAIRGGYVPLLYNRNESPPKVEKFCIMPTVYTMNNSASNNTIIKLVDLSKVYSKYRNDIVIYLWYADGQIIDKLTDIHYLYEFLNYKKEFDEYTEKVISINTSFEKEFCEEFLVKYRMYIESRFTNAGSIKGAFKPVRKYLKYFSAKYEVNSIDLQILNLSLLTTKLGGKPITDNDLKIIYNEFVQRQSLLGNGRLYTIVFEIFINTNLRIGEILNLKRDCLMYNAMNPKTATLYYFSKTAHLEIIEQEVNIKIIRLIEEAIQFTEKFKDNTFMSEYIFITPIKRKILFRCKRISFYWYCRDIFKSVEDDLEIKDYKPYNIRHTFIHNAYEEGVKEGYTILEISAVTGNSFKTAVRHYRNINYIDNYVEAFAKVIISNVDINGKILMYDDKKSTNIVRDNLGNCAKNHCTFEIAECLICNHFATFVNRIPEFEKKITSLNMELQKDKSNFQIEYINTEKRLLAKYLSELYKLRNNGEDK